MIIGEHPLKIVGVIGVSAISATLIALGLNVKDWRLLSAFSSAGCVLGASYLDSGKPMLWRLY